MKKDKTEQLIEQATTRKGEQEAVETLGRLESTEQLGQIMHAAERKHRSLRLRRQVWAFASAAAVIAIVLTIGLQPRYSDKELHERWSKKVVYEPIVLRGVDEEQEAFEVALALVQTGKENEAAEKFTTIAAHPTSEYTRDAQWQLAMLYLKWGMRKEALSLLDKIISAAPSFYTEDARLLRKEIKVRKLF